MNEHPLHCDCAACLNGDALPDRSAIDHQPRRAERDQVDEIVTAVAVQSRVTVDDILGRSRRHAINQARHEVWRRLREELRWSYPMIGKRFGVHHTTVMSALGAKPVRGKGVAA
jgi:chromosomal replication initiation ATPase DnaA